MASIRQPCPQIRVERLRAVIPGFTALIGHCSLRQVFLPSEVRFALLCAGLALIPVNAVRAMDRAPQVRLLFPVLTGEEFDQLLPLAPQATLIQINGSTYVLIAEFPDARVAHRLGSTIQRRLRIPFDLAYDPGHPQLDLARQQQSRAAAAAASAVEQERLPGPGAAELIEGGPLRLAFAGPVDASPQSSSPAPPRPATPTPTMAAETSSVSLRLPEEAGSPQSITASPGSQDRSGGDTAVAEGRTSSHPWLRGVAIQPVAVASPPISRLMPASNPDLNYLFVRLNDAQQVTALQRIVPVAELNLHQGRLLARVGVFTRTIKGQLMLEQRLQQLRRYPLQLLVARGEFPGAPASGQLEAG